MNAHDSSFGDAGTRDAGTRDAHWLPPVLMPALERRRLQCYLGLIISDMVGIAAAYWLAGYVYLGLHFIEYVTLFAQLALPVFLTIGLYNGAYSVLALQRTERGVMRSWSALAIAVVIVQFIAFYARANHEFSRVGVALGTALAMLALFATRSMMQAYVRWRCGSTVMNLLVIEDGGPPIAAEGCHVSAAELGLVPVLDDPHSLHRIGMVLRNADQVIISCPPERRRNWATILRSANVAGGIIDETVRELGAQGARIIGKQGILDVSSGPLGLRARITKRLFDLAVSISVLLVVSPVLLLASLAILIEDGRPILFVQRRVGRGNRFFPVFKFRSMKLDRLDTEGSASTARGDARVTAVGRFIRRTSIDELPQLFNVVLGEMSLVGPRPHAIGSQAGEKLFWEVDDQYWLRHALKPGITGLAQVRGWRGATDTEDDLQGRLRADLEYLRGWTLWRDLRILFATFRVIVHQQAY